MVSNTGFLVSEEEYQIQQPSCFPVIPSNQIPIRPQPNLSENQEGGSTKSYQNVSFQEGNWKEIQTSNGATACPESNFLLDQSSGIDNWEAAQRNITENNYYTQTLMNASHEWNNIPFTHLLASAEAAFGGLVSSVDGSDRNNPETRDYFLGSDSQINSNLQQQHESASMLLLNQNLSASANMFNTNSSSEMPQYGFPASHLPSYHLSSLSAYNAPMSLQFEPATPQKGKRVENYLSGMVNVGLEDQRNQVQERQKEAVETTVCNITEQSSYHSPPTVDSSSVIPSTPRNECQQLDKGLEQGTELDTPAAQQKQRRKKHRPKVIREGKPKRTPKPKTPKQEEHARVKRKYVRRKGINPPNSDSLDQANDRIDGHEEAANKTCKRSLFCNSEHEARDENSRKSSDNVENSSNSWRSNLSSAIQSQDSCTVVNTSHTNSTSENIQGLDGILEKSPTRALFDLNQSSPQMREAYLSLAEKQIREDLLVEPKKRNIPSAEDACLNSAENVYSHLPQKIVEWGVGSVAPSTITTGGLYSTPMNQNDSNCRTSVLLGEADEAMGSKRVYSHMIDKRNPHSQTLLQNLISRQVYKENNREHECQINTSNFVSFFTPINKKKRTEEGQHLVTYGELPSKRIPEDGSSQTTTSRQSIPNDNNVASQVRHGQSATQFINHSETTAITNRRNNSEGHQYVYSMSEGGNSRAQNVYAEQVSQKKSLSGPNCDKLPSNIDITGMMTKTTPEVSNRVYDLTSLTAVMEHNHLPPTPSKVEQRPRHKDINDVSGGSQSSMRALALDKYIKKRQIRKTPQLAKSTSYPLKSEVHSYERQVVLYDCYQTSARNKGPSSRRKRYLNPIDQIIQKLSCLSLNSESKTSRMRQQNALVPYGMVDTMVPYGEPFHPIKKRKPRPKVDLDPESDRVWKLLMGKECSQGVEGTDADKEKWWEEERRVFRGRADSFIARMHLVQGDRRFTRWKGSVVDSVIGVFLTQNVSDHLSSSAFMSLAARFPLQSTNSSEGTEVFVEEPEICILDSDDQEQCYEQLTAEPSCDQGSNTIQEPEHIEGKEVVVDSFGSNTGSSNLLISSKDKQSIVHTNGIDTLIEETETRCFLERENMKTTEDVVLSQNSVVSTENLVCSSILQTAERYGAMREHTRVAEVNDRSAQEDVISSQSSALSSQTSHSSVHQDAEQIGSCSDCNSEAQNMTGRESSSSDGPTSFLKLLQMAGMPHTMISQEYIDHENGNLLERDNKSTKEKSSIDRVDVQRNQYQSAYPSNVSLLLPETQNIAFSNFNLHTSPDSVVQGFEVERLGSPYQESKSPSLSVASGIKGIKCIDSFSKDNPPVSEITSSIPNHLPSCSEANMGRKYEVERTSIVPPENIPMEPANPVERGEDRMLQAGSCFQDFPREQVDVERTTALMASQKVIEKKVTKSNLHDQVGERTIKTLKAKGGPTKEKRENIDWDRLRKEAHLKGTERERTRNTMDTMDYEAIRCAEVGAIADTIKERGMNNMLAGRIKDFLNRVVRDHGSIDLEWLRDVPPDKAKEYLLSVRGLGLKSVECVRLLTLHHLAFPVDTNVGRIAVRLGWVPLQPLPESLQLHLLELYPVQESIQKYLWPRLCKLDQRTLYELHYQMITFGKVFCSKHKPNCNACPMRAECRHFASAFASARLALPGPEEKGIVTSNLPDVADTQPAVGIKSPQLSLPPPATKSNQLSFSDTSPLSRARSGTEICEPIIEEPSTPETTCIEVLQSDIEDAFYEDPDEIPVINLNIEEFTLNLTNYMQENNMQLQGDDVSKALVALNPEAASIPMPKLKNVSRLRTEHQVYELPDSHPLLEGRDRREPDDPCSYLLAIWTPGETADSIQPPERACSLQGSGHLCEDKTCFSCNSIREANSQIVRGTLLIPCRTAMRGSFPLNGTYFQVNEVFADHDSSLCPISVPRALIWNLPRRTVFFGSSVPTIFKGLSTEAIQSCFWRGFVCVRGFDQRTRAPRPLIARLHIPASRMNKNETKSDNKG